MVELEGRAVSGYFEDAGRRVLAGQALGRDEAMELGRRVGALPAQGGEAARALLDAARRVKEHHFGRRVGLCSIVNARSGSCSENCAFCAQSAHHRARQRGACREYPFIGLEAIVRAARAAREAGATRFGIVTSGKALGGADFQELLRAVAAVRGLGLAADASVGILPRRSLEALRDAGLGAYHHNLETARSFFGRICTTHAYDDDVDTVRHAVDLGLYVCSGGLFGLGEGWEHRVELALELRALGVPSVPVNFLTPIPGTPLEGRALLPADEALRIVALLRLLLPDRHIRICGGRPAVLGVRKAELLTCGASGIMVGDYLTTPGESVAADLADLERLGLVPEPAPPAS
jgi:biotin synthase